MLLTNEPGRYSENRARQQWRNTFTVIDLDQDEMISKAEHRRFFDAWKKFEDLVGAVVAFASIDEDIDGMISRDEFVEAAMDFHFNFTDETKCSKYFFSPLVKA